MAGKAERATRLENVLRRAYYAIAATKRIGGATLGGKPLTEATKAERPHLQAHRRAGKERLAGAKMNDAASERWGDVLSWHHGPVTHASRHNHVAASGKNYRVSKPPTSTEGLPGTLPGCGCTPSSPMPGAPLIG